MVPHRSRDTSIYDVLCFTRFLLLIWVRSSVTKNQVGQIAFYLYFFLNNYFLETLLTAKSLTCLTLCYTEDSSSLSQMFKILPYVVHGIRSVFLENFLGRFDRFYFSMTGRVHSCEVAMREIDVFVSYIFTYIHLYSFVSVS